MPLEDSFRPKHIINLLCRYRIKCAEKGRKKQLLRELTANPDQLQTLKFKDDIFDQLAQLLPPRKEWIRGSYKERLKTNDSVKTSLESIRNRVIRTFQEVRKGEVAPQWYQNLSAFITKLNKRITEIDAFKFDNPKTIPVVKEILVSKDLNQKITVCRPISVFNLEDRIILSLSTKYLLALFDTTFHDCSFAFRPVRFVNDETILIKHHDAIKEILNFKQRITTSKLWVAECDINKFFDCVNHKTVKKIFYDNLNEFKKKKIYYDDKIGKIFTAYLDCYSFTNDVYPLNNNLEYFSEYKIKNGRFDYPEKKLKQEFYKRDNIIKRRLGIPQGGAISCFIANLLLHEIDKKIYRSKNDDYLYVRYCDDMVLIDINEKKCAGRLASYIKEVKRLKLLPHLPKKIPDYIKSDCGYNSAKLFWSTKSKEPYKWGFPQKGKSISPWLAFVGYQIKYNGQIRVRKKSLTNEIKKQSKIKNQVLKVLNVKDSKNIHLNSKKSFNQQIQSLQGRLISMSVGKFGLHNFEDLKKNKQRYCWTNGFSQLNKNGSTSTQLKTLDRNRNRQFSILKKKLFSLKGVASTKPPAKRVKKNKPPKHYGKPFSYHYFLYKQPSH
jgi:retron-type reverse transcriptase